MVKNKIKEYNMLTDLDKWQREKYFCVFLIYVHVIYDDTVFVWVLQNVQLHMQIMFELLLIGDNDLSVIYLIVLRWLTWLPEVFCNVH